MADIRAHVKRPRRESREVPCSRPGAVVGAGLFDQWFALGEQVFSLLSRQRLVLAGELDALDSPLHQAEHSTLRLLEMSCNFLRLVSQSAGV